MRTGEDPRAYTRSHVPGGEPMCPHVLPRVEEVRPRAREAVSRATCAGEGGHAPSGCHACATLALLEISRHSGFICGVGFQRFCFYLGEARRREMGSTDQSESQALVSKGGRERGRGQGRGHHRGTGKGRWRSQARGRTVRDREVFSTYATCEGCIWMANNVSSRVVGRGLIRFRMANGRSVTLTEVRHVLNLRKNLISIGMLDSKGCSFDASGGILRVSNENKKMLWGKKTRGLYRLEGSVQIGGATVRHGSSGISKKSGQGKQSFHRGTQSKRRGNQVDFEKLYSEGCDDAEASLFCSRFDQWRCSLQLCAQGRRDEATTIRKVTYFAAHPGGECEAPQWRGVRHLGEKSYGGAGSEAVRKDNLKTSNYPLVAGGGDCCSSRRYGAPAPNRVGNGVRPRPHVPFEDRRVRLVSATRPGSLALLEISRHSGFICGVGFQRFCFYLGEEGHIKRDCLKFKAQDQSSDTAATAVMAVDESDVLLATSDNEKSDWVLDSGSAYHLYRDREVFSTYATCEGCIWMANNVSSRVVGRGLIRFRMANGRSVTLTEVRHVLNLRKNLISIGMLDSKGCSFDASGGILRVSKENKKMLWGKKTRGLYRLEGSVQTGGATVRHGSSGISKKSGQGKQSLHRGTQSKRRGNQVDFEKLYSEGCDDAEASLFCSRFDQWRCSLQLCAQGRRDEATTIRKVTYFAAHPGGECEAPQWRGVRHLGEKVQAFCLMGEAGSEAVRKDNLKTSNYPLVAGGEIVESSPSG
ncbi:hypothetical protein Acr_08g0014770 [Actinidia rufa]|uniref:Retrovirus-related Pol polyprotein from transposon TNT 1-94-like beta-barrel domain-containing protein n=1 Tax=Actinidia rufa TaxID=165716 RepID=A0A7J0F309_9ERIC|nr:hypothetical protein Acr_08g0014770 [Actinidia rufa]